MAKEAKGKTDSDESTKTGSGEATASSNGSNGAEGNPDTGQLLDAETLAELSTLTRDPGGPEPSKSILKMSAHTKDIGNQFDGEEEVVFQVHARCEEVSFKGVKRVHHFDVIDIFQDEAFDAELIERFKDRLEEYGADKDTRALIEEFLDSCVAEDAAAEPEGEEPDPDAATPEEPAAAAEPEEPAGELDLAAEGAESIIDGDDEPIDGEIVSEGDPEAAAMDEAAGDLDWGEETPPE